MLSVGMSEVFSDQPVGESVRLSSSPFPFWSCFVGDQTQDQDHVWLYGVVTCPSGSGLDRTWRRRVRWIVVDAIAR